MKDKHFFILPDPIQSKADEVFYKKLTEKYWSQPPMTREQLVFEFFDDYREYPDEIDIEE